MTDPLRTENRLESGAELPEDLARRCAAAMWQNDRASQGLGMAIAKIGPGYARLTMRIREDMVNGHEICHGGFIFALADSAFAFACNSYNHNTVASACAIDFLAPGRLGDVLTATCEERSATGRTGVYDVEVANQEGVRVALFRGKSYRIKGHLVPETPPASGRPGIAPGAA